MTQFYAMRADAWSALGSCIAAAAALLTLIIAAVAAFIAWRQVGEMRAARAQTAVQAQEAQAHAKDLMDEQAQPNVSAFLEANAIEWRFTELVVKNFGLTPAYDVRLTIRPTPRVSPASEGESPTELRVPDTIPFLAPGQEWRTWWDFGVARTQYNKKYDASDERALEMVYDATVAYADSKGKPLRTTSVLSFEMFANTQRARFQTVDTIGRSLESLDGSLQTIASTLKAAAAERH